MQCKRTYLTANGYCRRIFGEKIYKLSLSAAVTCPNRDGTVGRGGCSFCSAGGSGDFAAAAALPLREQLENAKRLVRNKQNSGRYIAYFQSFTGTHGSLPLLEQRYQEAISRPEIVGLSIATRPDCLGTEALAMLERLARQKPLWVELGLQTIHEATAQRINRCYPLETYEEAMKHLKELGVHRITHLILGLPGEGREAMLESVRYVGERTDGIKLQLLHVLEGTRLAEEYRRGEFTVFSLEEYSALVADAVEGLPESVVIHRLTGDGPKKSLVAPLWSGDKKRVLAAIQKELRSRGMEPEQ